MQLTQPKITQEYAVAEKMFYKTIIDIPPISWNREGLTKNISKVHCLTLTKKNAPWPIMLRFVVLLWIIEFINLFLMHR